MPNGVVLPFCASARQMASAIYFGADFLPRQSLAVAQLDYEPCDFHLDRIQHKPPVSDLFPERRGIFEAIVFAAAPSSFRIEDTSRTKAAQNHLL